MKEVEKKVTVKRSRRSSGAGAITVKRRRSTEASHIVDLKNQSSSEIKIETMPAEDRVRPVLKSKAPWPFGVYKKIAVTFVVLAIAILGIVAYFSLVKLDIKVTPKIKAISGQASFMVYDRPEDYSIPAGGILGMVREMDLEYKNTFSSTGTELIGAEVSGTVTLVNTYSKDQPLVATTRLLTPDNQLLRLKDTVVVPAGASIEAAVYGDSLDPSFTLADTKLTIPGLWAGLQDKIYATAKAGDVSYREQKKMSVTQADLDQALETAKKALLAKAETDIASVYQAYDERIYELDENSLTFSFDAKAGDEKESFTITMNTKVNVVAFKRTALEGLSETTLDSILAKGQSLVGDEANLGSFKVLSADVDDNVAQVELSVSGEATPATPTDIIDKSKLVGLTRSQIESYLNSLETIDSYSLEFHPSFFEIAPQLVDRINVIIK